MKYLLPLFMFISAVCTAQPRMRGLSKGIAGYERAEGTSLRVDVGVSGGITMVTLAERGWRDQNIVHNGKVWLTEVDLCYDRNKLPVAFKQGARLGDDVFGKGFFSYVLGAQFNTAPEKDLGVRFSLMTGPMFSNFRPDLLAEATAGVLIAHRISIGLKYMLPFWAISTVNAHDGSDYGSDYKLNYVLLEVKARCGFRD